MSSFNEDSFEDDEVLLGTPRSKLRKMLELPNPMPTSRRTFSGFQRCANESSSPESEYFTTENTRCESFIEQVAEILNQPTRNSPETTCTNVEDAFARLKVHLPEDDPQVQTVEIISDDEIDQDFPTRCEIQYEDITIEESHVEPTTTEAVHNESLVFDDTLDDINRFLAGENSSSAEEMEKSLEPRKEYLVVPHLEVTQATSRRAHVADAFKMPQTTRRTRKSPKMTSRFENIVSPVASYIHRPVAAKSPRCEQPKRTFFRTPEGSGVAKKKSDKFKAVQSPIGLYIKHSTKPVTQRNVRYLRELHAVPESMFDEAPPSSMDDAFFDAFEIPQTIYRPAASKVEAPHVLTIKLPANIKALVPNIEHLVLVEHEGGHRTHAQSNESIAFELEHNSNLTQCDHHDDDGDVSFLSRKPFY